MERNRYGNPDPQGKLAKELSLLSVRSSPSTAFQLVEGAGSCVEGSDTRVT